MKDKHVFPQDEKSFTSKMGITKREYFAGQAMQGWIASGRSTSPENDRAKYFVELADALIKELEK